MKKKVTVEFMFSDEAFDLDAITCDYILSILREAGLIGEENQPKWRVTIELLDEKDEDNLQETALKPPTPKEEPTIDFEELYNRIATEREKLELKRLKRHEKLQRLIHKRPHHKAYIT
ncbi:MAG: hypothetical protein QXK47_04440 [Candidatus Bathyarchaeia archaeon]|nr:hypothetical protein [Candidatus Bathyarchaeota archaeon]